MTTIILFETNYVNTSYHEASCPIRLKPIDLPIMAAISNALDLSTDNDVIYHAADEYLSNVLVSYGCISSGATSSSSRIRVTIFTSAGYQHYPRITLAPTSPLYTVVNHLPREKQGDEVCRGIAVSLLKYFVELPDNVKDALLARAQTIKSSTHLPKMFDPMHAADIASRMTKLDNSVELIQDIQAAFGGRVVSSANINLMLPSSCFQSRKERSNMRGSVESLDLENRYGMYTEVVEQLGDPVFIPNSKVRRAPSRSASTSKSTKFTRSQKEALRLAMCEIVDTEERYVAKIYDLMISVIRQCRQEAKIKSVESSSPGEDALKKLFPPCLDEIFGTNNAFLNSIRTLLETTEAEAFDDISKDVDTPTFSKKHDPLGAIALGKIMLEHFPKFSQPYKEYMRLQPDFASTLAVFMKDPSSSFSKRVQQTGEQKLRSLLMEPVQRLPRYSLLIDAMTATMPAKHPALKYLLKARDVITDICALENPGIDENMQMARRLVEQVDGWPSSLLPQGRIVTAIDVEGARPPFRFDRPQTPTRSHMLVLFPDSLIFLHKTPDCTISARNFVAGLDKGTAFGPSHITFAEQPRPGLQYSWSIPVSSAWVSHSQCGRVLHLACSQDTATCDPRSGAFKLIGPDEKKAAKFCEDLSKAKTEHRFTNEERIGDKWSLHSLRAGPSSAQFFTAVCEEDSESSPERMGDAEFCILFGKSRAERQRLLNPGHTWAVASVSRVSNRYKVEVDYCFGTGTVDVTTLEDIFGVLSRRFSSLLGRLYSTDNSALIQSTIITNSRILDVVSVAGEYYSKNSKGRRTRSPTKLLAAFWGGSSTKENNTSKAAPAAAVLGEVPSFMPSSAAPLPPQATKSNIERSDSRVKLVGSNDDSKETSFQLLEQTFTAYVLSLRSRAGNIVGKTLCSRDSADKTAVNDLYNVLLEDPSKIQAAAEVSNDVLFTAFEDFIWNAWKAEIGPIIDMEMLKQLKSYFDLMLPIAFHSTFRGWLNSISPQNKRALTAIIKLLADLLDTSGNDADRGALTLAFADLLSARLGAYAYIPLLDKLVEDYEIMFDDNTTVGFQWKDFPFGRPQSENSQDYAGKSGSVSSQTSSFRKRFGFGLNRGDGKNEGESKVSSIIRSLSKSKSGNETNSQSSSISKGSLIRSRSTDTDSRITSFLRPLSRDRPPTATTVGDDRASNSRPTSSHSGVDVMHTIGELPPRAQKMSQKKKRRSSLSDLKPLNSASPPVLSPIQLRKPLSPVRIPSPTPVDKPLPQPAAKADIPIRSASLQKASPIRTSPRKENITSPTANKQQATSTIPRPNGVSPTKGYLSERAVNRKSDEVVAKSYSPKKRSDTQTNIPAPKPGQRERPISSPTKFESPTKRPAEQLSPQKIQPKLRMQSPQKVSHSIPPNVQTLNSF